MANNIVLKTYRGGSVTPQDDAIIHQTVIGTNGIFKGCNVTYARGNTLHISQGFGMIKGRFFEVYECEVGVILNNAAGTLPGRLYIHMDLSNADEPIQILSETASVLSDLMVDEDVNYNNTAFDLELATFGVTRTGITDLVQTFEKITGASGGGGGTGSLQRATTYNKGDFVTCKNAPGWVTLYCIVPGETAATEPAEYANITQVGDSVRDGTCLFTARDVIGELDIIKEICGDNETSLSSLESNVQELREIVVKQIENPSVAVGTVQFMPSDRADESWLLCDGSFVSEKDYPELVSALGKLLPDGEKFKLLSDGEVAYQISNGVIYNGKMWVYSYSAQKLYGIDLTGEKPIKVIPVSSTSNYFSSFSIPTQANPLILSIVPHQLGTEAKLFLTQFLASGEDRNVNNEYSWTSYFLVFGAEFSGEDVKLTVEPPFTKITRKMHNSSYYYTPNFKSTQNVPYVVSRIVSGEERYYCAIGDRTDTGNYTHMQGALVWSDGKTEADVEGFSSYFPSSAFKNQRGTFSEKNRGDIVMIDTTSSTRPTYSIYSYPAGNYAATSKSYTGTIIPRESAIPLNVASDTKVLSTFDVNCFPWAAVSAAKAGTTEPGLALPRNAKVFPDAAAYLWGKDIFLIFVGTGIIFSHDLEEGSFGYLDLTSLLGTISQFGYLDYSFDERYLYILGQDTQNRVKLGRLELNTQFDYSGDGAWLPLIMSDGLPAYIKAKETPVEPE